MQPPGHTDRDLHIYGGRDIPTYTYSGVTQVVTMQVKMTDFCISFSGIIILNKYSAAAAVNEAELNCVPPITIVKCESKQQIDSVTRLGNYLTLGNFLKPLATINLSKSATFLGNFCTVVKIYQIQTTFIDIRRFFSGHTDYAPRLCCVVMDVAESRLGRCGQRQRDGATKTSQNKSQTMEL